MERIIVLIIPSVVAFYIKLKQHLVQQQVLYFLTKVMYAVKCQVITLLENHIVKD